MEITAETGHQTEFPRQNRQSPHLLQRLHAVDHFQGVTTALGEIGNQSAAFATGEIVLPGMRQADPGTRIAQGVQGFLEAWPMLFDIAELARSEPFTKRLGMIPHMPGTHQKLRKVRASRRIAAVAPLLLYLARALKRTRHALGSQALANQFGALPTASMQLGDGVFQRTRLRVKGIAEHMNGRPIPLR